MMPCVLIRGLVNTAQILETREETLSCLDLKSQLPDQEYYVHYAGAGEDVERDA